VGKKARKAKLGSIFNCSITDKKDDNLVCRVINCERIAEYQIDAYFKALARIELYNLTNVVSYPVGVCLDEKDGFLTIVETKKRSLYEVLH
jgi:hypothetical protein